MSEREVPGHQLEPCFVSAESISDRTSNRRSNQLRYNRQQTVPPKMSCPVPWNDANGKLSDPRPPPHPRSSTKLSEGRVEMQGQAANIDSRWRMHSRALAIQLYADLIRL